MLTINNRGRTLLVVLTSVLALVFAQTPAVAAASQADRDRVQWRAMSYGRWGGPHRGRCGPQQPGAPPRG